MPAQPGFCGFNDDKGCPFIVRIVAAGGRFLPPFPTPPGCLTNPSRHPPNTRPLLQTAGYKHLVDLQKTPFEKGATQVMRPKAGKPPPPSGREPPRLMAGVTTRPHHSYAYAPFRSVNA